jgi:hypothetical protein
MMKFELDAVARKRLLSELDEISQKLTKLGRKIDDDGCIIPVNRVTVIDVLFPAALLAIGFYFPYLRVISSLWLLAMFYLYQNYMRTEPFAQELAAAVRNNRSRLYGPCDNWSLDVTLLDRALAKAIREGKVEIQTNGRMNYLHFLPETYEFEHGYMFDGYMTPGAVELLVGGSIPSKWNIFSHTERLIFATLFVHVGDHESEHGVRSIPRQVKCYNFFKPERVFRESWPMLMELQSTATKAKLSGFVKKVS